VPDTNKDSSLDSAALNREKARLRLIGIIALVVGLVTAGLVYWLGTRAENARLDQYQDAVTRSESRQMQMLYGTSGGIVDDILNGLKRPGNQALLILAAGGIIAAGCFYLGRPLPEEDGSKE
jgi:hypothetical protein